MTLILSALLGFAVIGAFVNEPTKRSLLMVCVIAGLVVFLWASEG